MENKRSEGMDFEIEEIRDYYDAELQAYEVAMKMRQQGEYTSYKYACELRRLFEQIDPAQ